MLLSNATLNVVKKWKELGFYDTAQVLDHQASDTMLPYGHEAHQFLPGLEFPCRFLPISGSPRPAPDALEGAAVPMQDADLYFKGGFRLTPHDRVRILKLHGQVQDPILTYEIVAGPIQESTGARCTLALVTT